MALEPTNAPAPHPQSMPDLASILGPLSASIKAFAAQLIEAADHLLATCGKPAEINLATPESSGETFSLSGDASLNGSHERGTAPDPSTGFDLDLGTYVRSDDRTPVRMGEPEGEGEKGGETFSQLFNRFWSAYPRKVGKKAALKAFTKINPNGATVDWFVDVLARHGRTREWREGFIPHASTWLNGERWADEIEPVARRGVPLGGAAPAAALGWREACPHTPTCGTPTRCALLRATGDAS